MAQIELVVLDIDGVLKGPDGIPEQTQWCLQHHQSRGLRATYATGRSFRIAEGVTRGFTPNAPLILEGGGRVAQGSGENLLFNPLPNPLLQQLQLLLANGHVCLAGFGCRNTHHYRFLVRTVEGEKLAQEFLAVTEQCTSDPMEFQRWIVDGACSKLSLVARSGSCLEFPSGIEVACTDGWHDICAPGVSKGSALRWLCDYLDIASSATLVAGNGENDIPMFSPDIGIRVAVGKDCPAALVERCTHHIDSHRDLAAFLDSVLS